jgi:TetR/AcrR family transcriptional regulator, regulator of cefoperazone and chloramphenicol sensitivity
MAMHDPADARRSEHRGGDTSARILAVAVELFATRGYAGTSIRDITDRLAITKAALYYHFTSKEEIIAALVAPLRAEVKALLAADDLSAPELIGQLVDIVSRRGAVVQALMTDPSVISHAHQSGPKEDFRQLARNLAAVGEVPLISARCALGAIQAGVFGAAADRHALIDADRARQLVEGEADLLDDLQRTQVVAAAIRALGGAPS